MKNDNNKISSPFSKTNQHDQKYKTILSAASELFNIHGTRATTLTQIAEKLNLTKTSLYYYVKTKEELVYQCYLNTCVEMQQLVQKSLASKGLAINKLELLLQLNFDCWSDIIDGNRGHLAGLTEIAALSKVHQLEISKYYRHFVLQVIEIINEGKEDGSIKDINAGKTSNAIWGSIFWLPIWLFNVDKCDREDTFVQWRDIFKYGLNSGTECFKFKDFLVGEQSLAPTAFDRSEQNRKKIEAFLKVGSTFFNQKGFKGTSLDELAKSLGVTKGAFYYHIKNKEDLLIKCFERTITIEKLVLNNALNMDESAIEKLSYSARKLFEIQAGEQGPLIRYATMWSLNQQQRSHIEAATEEVRGVIGDIIRAGILDSSIKEVNPYIAENMIAGAVESIPDMALTIDSSDILETSNQFFDIFFNGIAT